MSQVVEADACGFFALFALGVDERDEDSLRNDCGRFGEVTRMLRKGGTSPNVFVRFATKEQAEKALGALKNKWKITPAAPNRVSGRSSKPFLKNIRTFQKSTHFQTSKERRFSVMEDRRYKRKEFDESMSTGFETFSFQKDVASVKKPAQFSLFDDETISGTESSIYDQKALDIYKAKHSQDHDGAEPEDLKWRQRNGRDFKWSDEEELQTRNLKPKTRRNFQERHPEDEGKSSEINKFSRKNGMNTLLPTPELKTMEISQLIRATQMLNLGNEPIMPKLDLFIDDGLDELPKHLNELLICNLSVNTTAEELLKVFSSLHPLHVSDPMYNFLNEDAPCRIMRFRTVRAVTFVLKHFRSLINVGGKLLSFYRLSSILETFS